LSILLVKMETSQLSIKEIREYAKKKYILLADRWRHRRRMAYIAIISMLIVTYCCLFKLSPEKIKVLENIISWFYLTMGSIVGAYVGFATLDDKWRKEDKKSEE